MKKLVLAVLAIILMSISSFGQTKGDDKQEGFVPIPGRFFMDEDDNGNIRIMCLPPFDRVCFLWKVPSPEEKGSKHIIKTKEKRLEANSVERKISLDSSVEFIIR